MSRSKHPTSDSLFHISVSTPREKRQPRFAVGVRSRANSANSSNCSTESGHSRVSTLLLAFILLGCAASTLVFVHSRAAGELISRVRRTQSSSPASSRGISTAASETHNNAVKSAPNAVFLTPTLGAYTWAPLAGSTNFQLATNWSPNRLLPDPGDILIVSGGTPIIDNVPTQTIGALQLGNLALVTLKADTTLGTTKTLTISGGGGSDFLVPQGTSLSLAGSTALVIELTNGSKGTVGGFINAGGSAHQLIATGGSTVTFTGADSSNKAFFATASDYDANTNPFGAGTGGSTGDNNSIVFGSFSYYAHSSGGSPSGAVGGGPVCKFQTGSEARIFNGTNFQASGRTYANLSIGALDPSGIAVNAADTGSGNFQFDNLTINAQGTNNSSLSFTGTGSSTTTIGGDIISKGAGTGTLPDVTLTAPGGVTINKSGSITFGNDGSNSRAVNLDGNVTVTAGTTLNLSRIVQLGLTNPNTRTLTVDYGGELNGGSDAYVIGSVLQNFGGVSSITGLAFPVGTANGYSPVNVSNASGTGTLKISATGNKLASIPGPHALSRFWTIASSGVTQADLEFQYNGADVVGDEDNYRVFKNDGSFSQPANQSIDTGTHTATVTGVTSFSDWTLAEIGSVFPPPTNLVVTKTDDTDDGVCDSDCSLREAIAAANSNPDTNTITFNIPLSDAGCNFGAGPCTITLGGTELEILESVNIDNSTSGEAIIVDGDFSSRVFTISGGTVTLSALTITNGDSSSSDFGGGGILNNGTLSVSGCTISLNYTQKAGGGIRNAGTLKVINSTISGNSAENNGGGIHNDRNTAHLTVTNSTIANNIAGTDCFNDSGTCSGGGIFNNHGTVFLRNTIVAGNFNADSPTTFSDDINGGVNTGSANNLIGDGTNLTGITNGNQGNQIGTSASPINPRLAPLSNNGGPTQTHALLPLSPAIDAGNDCVLTANGCGDYNPVIVKDQRGVSRPQLSHVDIGAFEMVTAVVNTTADHAPGLCEALPGGDCTLREAINLANADPFGSMRISFAIPTGPGGDPGCDANGVCTINVDGGLGALPPITKTVFIDGYSQTGASPNTLDLDVGDNAVLKIELSGVNLLAGACGLDFQTRSPGSSVSGLSIYQFKGAGVCLQNEGDNQVYGNFIGIRATGTAAVAGNGDGVRITNGEFNLIGGDTPAERNVISGNTDNGVNIIGDGTIENSVEGNYIGTDKDGLHELPNAIGVFIGDFTGGNIVGCEVLNGDNVISGNTTAGVQILESQGNLIEGNLIGTDNTGLAPLPNGIGVQLTDAPLNSIGLACFGNLISGNKGAGVQIDTTDDSSFPSLQDEVMANRIGTDITGCTALPNSVGVLIQNSSQNTVGSGSPGDRNTISGNTGEGIRIEISNPGGTSVDNAVFGNYIGTNVFGKAALPNGGAGVELSGGEGNEVGCTFYGSGNVISGNTGNGVEITAGASNNFVQSNLIGLKRNGTGSLGNGGSGVEVYGPTQSSSNNVIGVEPGVERFDRNRFSSITPKSGPCRQGPFGVALYNRTDKSQLLQKVAGISQKVDAVKPPSLQPRRRWVNKKRIKVDRFAAKTPAESLDQKAGVSERTEGVVPLISMITGANVIAYNTGDGVKVSTYGDVNNLISQNSIYANGKLGINLVASDPPLDPPNGVTFNDVGDGDNGPNHLQNFPHLTVAAADTQTISGILDSPSGSYIIEIFSSNVCDGSNYGEGRNYRTNYQTSGGAFSFTADPGTFTAGQIITATATDSDGNTSEFSRCLVATATTPPPAPEIAVEQPTGTDLVDASSTVDFGTQPVGITGAPQTFTIRNVGSADLNITLPITKTGDASDFTVDTSGTSTIITPGNSATFTVTFTPSLAGTRNAAIHIANNDSDENGFDIALTGVGCPSTFLIDSNADTDDNYPGDGFCATAGGVCTLRAAVTEANALVTCSGTIDINFNIGSTTIVLLNGELAVNHDVRINGPAGNSVVVSGNNSSRIFNIGADNAVSISNLTISNGLASGADGGGLYNAGALTLNGVTLSGNSAENGGAIVSQTSNSLVLTNTTVSGNSAKGDGGGLFVASGQATLTNVTVAYNRSDSDGNGSGDGGGIACTNPTVLLHNTIVTDNLKGANPSSVADDISGTVDSLSTYNVIGTGSGGLSDGSNNNQTGVVSGLLGPLLNNGGPTFTHALLYNSPAVDTGDSAVLNSPLFLSIDQRGRARPDDGDNNGTSFVDIGAYERQKTETRNVPDGQTVNVDIADARLTFPCVPAANCIGTEKAQPAKPNLAPDLISPSVSLTLIDPSGQPAPPIGFVDGNSVSPPLPAFEVSPISLTYDTPVTICFYLPSINDQSFFNGLKVFHNEGGTLVDRTSSFDFNNRLVCAQVTSFSPFVIGHSASPTAADGNVSGQIVDDHGQPVEGAAVRLSGTQNRLAITDASGNYRFDSVEANGFYVVTPARANYSFSPSQRSFSALGQHTEALFSASSTNGRVNPLDTTEYFVRQQYLDFLGREPDEAGFNFWVNNIESCGSDQSCREAKRVDTSAAFFLSIEFQQTGYLVYRTYQAAFGDLPTAPVPVRINEFRPDTAEIGKGVVVNKSGWETLLDNNKQSYAAEFVQRPRFALAYPASLTPTEFVDRLFTNAAVTPSASDRQAALNQFGSSATSGDAGARSRALLRVAENSSLARQEFTQAFVLMQYFGYLRRDPNTGADADFAGYDFWLSKLNSFDGVFGDADMVKAFLLSGEYRDRFPR
jgi:CSLREA domain-containing protein